jgi:DNA-binding LacI/PurR family transcriptional regulator
MSDVPPGAGEHVVRGRVRLIDVATRTGVTKATASRILNGDPTLNVRPDTRDRVWAAARELGYRPHAGARALAGAEARALALLIPDLSNPVYSRIVRGAYHRARTLDYVVLLAEDPDEDEGDESFAELVQMGRVDGLLIASARPNHRLLSSPKLGQIPYVFVNRTVPGSHRNIGMNLAEASRCAVRHLNELGHTSIGHVAGPAQLEPARARQQGFIAQMTELGLPSRIEHDDFTERGGAAAAMRLLHTHPELTALYAGTLSQAVGTMHAVRELGLRIPEDVSVISYDDLPLAEYLDPPLTTVAMPLDRLGAAAIDAVVDQIRGHRTQDVTIPDAPHIVARRSTRPPRDAAGTGKAFPASGPAVERA